MSIEKKAFGTLDNKDIYLFVLDNGCGLSAEIINYGGIVRTLTFKGTDVVLGRDTLEEYLENNGCFGALIGRNSNRIAGASFVLNGKKYALAVNNIKANLHGGNVGFNKKVWDASALDGDEPSLVLILKSPDGEEGFPGNADIKVTYTLTRDNALKIHYEGVCDQDSIINLTNHTYFNLNGHKSGTVDNHTLKLLSDFYTPNTPECYPTGEVLKTEGTPFDLRQGKLLGDVFNSDCEQIRLFNGFDHNFALSGFGMRSCGTLKGDITGIEMELLTDRPAVQIYTGNSIQQGRICKNGAVYPIHGGVCLETQVFPNFTANSHFPGGFVKSGEKYNTVTEYRFK